MEKSSGPLRKYGIYHARILARRCVVGRSVDLGYIRPITFALIPRILGAEVLVNVS